MLIGLQRKKPLSIPLPCRGAVVLSRKLLESGGHGFTCSVGTLRYRLSEPRKETVCLHPPDEARRPHLCRDLQRRFLSLPPLHVLHSTGGPHLDHIRGGGSRTVFISISQPHHLNRRLRQHPPASRPILSSCQMGRMEAICVGGGPSGGG